MKPSEYSTIAEINPRDAFGAFVKARREELGMSVRQLAGKAGVTQSHISDIEKGNRNASKNLLEVLAKALQLPQDQMADFTDLAGVPKNNWQDLNDYLGKNPGARKFVRYARDNNMSGEEFMKAVDQIIAQSSNNQPAEPANE